MGGWGDSVYLKKKCWEVGPLLWRQEQKEEATCNQKVVSEIEFHLGLYTCYSLKEKKHYKFLALWTSAARKGKCSWIW